MGVFFRRGNNTPTFSAFQKKLLGIFVPKGDELSGESSRNELRTLYSSPHVFRENEMDSTQKERDLLIVIKVDGFIQT
jgi:hypothetical protein